jgi:predicted DNA binding protein/FixJ family two-component response regulator/GAF domain-containing protein
MTEDVVETAWREHEEIVVALVDDDPEWLSVQASLLRRRNDRFVVETETDPRAVLDRLDEVDCVVSDYKMRPLDGLELLERVRETSPTLPFIITTGRGSETVASRAITAGVTDYVVERPSRDQSAVLATRIVSAVTRRRVERRLSESHQRFTELFEAIPGPVAITDCDGTVESANSAYEATFGDTDRLPPAVRDTPVDEQCELDCETADGRQVFLHRKVRLTGRERCCHTFTGITARAEREAARKLELETREAVREALLSASTRAGLERAFCRCLADVRGYPLVWIGERDVDGSLVVRESAGTESDRVDVADATADADPGVRALEEYGPVFANDLSWPAGDGGRTVASGGAVPLRHNELAFGVIAAYASSPGAFDDSERGLLSDLADLLAYAINFVTVQRALFGGERVEVTVTTPTAAYPVASLFDGPVTVDGTVPHEDDAVRHIVSVPESTTWDAAANRGVRSVRDIGSDGTLRRLAVVLSRPTVDSLLVDSGARIESISLRADRVAVVASFSARDGVESAIETITEEFPDASVTSYRTVDRIDGDRDADPTAALTTRQRTALETAYYGGYFEQPKRRNSEELAATLDISRSTFLQHLRSAQRKLFDAVLDAER